MLGQDSPTLVYSQDCPHRPKHGDPSGGDRRSLVESATCSMKVLLAVPAHTSSAASSDAGRGPA